MRDELPIAVKISDVIDEAKGIKSIFFKRVISPLPGQFIMIWLPSIDSKPLAVSYLSDDRMGITVSEAGPWSKKLYSMKVGDYIGVFGPYGNSFELTGNNIMLVGGGYGTASLMLLAEDALKKKCKVSFIIGARTQNKLLFRDRLQTMGLDIVFTTDDGTFGRPGTTVEALSELIKQSAVSTVYGCGPELMEKSLAEFCVSRGIKCYLSLERHMKCGFGVCGACAMDPTGERVCCEGPVFSAEKALQFTEFGKFERDGSATKHFFNASR